jgi:hypothetical protein
MFVQDGFLYLIVTQHKLTVQESRRHEAMRQEAWKQEGRNRKRDDRKRGYRKGED